MLENTRAPELVISIFLSMKRVVKGERSVKSRNLRVRILQRTSMALAIPSFYGFEALNANGTGLCFGTIALKQGLVILKY
ncbi:hypothetical protein [Marininema halotolerans]|uniref:Uncharacterized protein n=1 Tax=Marininema halotolerans TaxID=1155944 RepID=A0A1I6NUB5_9BACL|nr:hypothetical protein [Marininema halotolerans]SFS31448.1 hypothetical protein SAMN05444972_101134 [Marininema halotolerans]